MTLPSSEHARSRDDIGDVGETSGLHRNGVVRAQRQGGGAVRERKGGLSPGGDQNARLLRTQALVDRAVFTSAFQL
jgi:hypothetical protein